MLTALDFPDGLLYSAEAIWLRDTGVGTARVGLQAYAAFPGGAHVFLVKLPRGGARIEKGRPFGHVEVAGRTVPLVAPVSGSVLFQNKALRDDPMLLVRDPFGEGFLVELDGVAQEEMDALLDRDDAVREYGRFEPEGGVGADQVIQPGRPWPTSLALRWGGSALVSARLLPPAGNEVFTPDWVTGDAWTVETRTADETTRRFAFEVLGDGRVAGEETVRVRAVEVAAPGAEGTVRPAFHRVLHYRLDDHTLAAVDEVATDDPLSVRRRFNPRGHEPWLDLADAPDGFIFDAPRLPVTLDDEARDLPKIEDAPGRKGVPALSHYVKFRGGLTRIEAEMRSDVPREDGQGTERLLSVQVYERGEPWWSEASRTLGDREIARARLVR